MQNGEKENQVKELDNNKNKKKSKIVREVLVSCNLNGRKQNKSFERREERFQR